MNGPEAAEEFGQVMVRAARRMLDATTGSLPSATLVILGMIAELRPLCAVAGVQSQAASTIAALAELAMDAARKESDARTQGVLRSLEEMQSRLDNIQSD